MKEITGFEDEVQFEEEVEVVSSTVRSESRKKFAPSTPTRSLEEYEAMIESVEMITLYRKDGSSYEAKLTKFKPEDNPMEHIRPVFVYGTM